MTRKIGVFSAYYSKEGRELQKAIVRLDIEANEYSFTEACEELAERLNLAFDYTEDLPEDLPKETFD